MEILSSHRVAIAELLKKELSPDIVAMLNEALNEGYAFADVVAMLGEAGYQVAIKPCKDEMDSEETDTEAPETEEPATPEEAVVESFMGRFKEALAEKLGLTKKEYEPVLNLRQQVMYEAYEQIAETFGTWDDTTKADGAHYIPAAKNVFAGEGIACKNCVFYEGGGGCEILSMQVEPDAACKLWVIPDNLITAPVAEKAHGPHSFKESADKKVNCSVCGTDKGNWRHMIKQQGAEAVIAKEVGEKRYTLAPMYIPDQLDAHGEWTDPDELQRAVWDYVKSGDRRIRLQHNRDIVAGEWVEVMQIPYPMNVPMYKSDGAVEQRTYPAGTVFLGVQWEPWAWELVKDGKVSGYSIGGRTERVMAEMKVQ